MSKLDWVKFEIFTWKKISHGLFDYHNKNCHLTNLKVEPVSQVFVRVGDAVKSFPNFEAAYHYKAHEFKPKGNISNGINGCTLFFWLLKEKESLKVFGYNQLDILFNYYDESQSVESIGLNLKDVFPETLDIKAAKTLLTYLSAEDCSKDLWKVAKTLDWRKSNKLSKIQSKGVELHEGNIIKMGRLKMKLKTIKLNSTFKNKTKNQDKKAKEEADNPVELKDISYQLSEKTDDIAPCRFCLSSGMDDPNNPLINPCLWRGTQGLIHIECLKSWMSAKSTHRVFSEFTEMYTWKTMNCELCHAPYPFKINFNNQTISLLEYEEPPERHLVFETFLKEGCTKATSKSVYILRLKSLDRFRVGRSHEVQFHIEDISVSRIHAELLLINNKIIIKDVKSKFGTQILSKNIQSLDKTDMTMNMYQIGRTWLMANYESNATKSSFFCCLGAKPTNTAAPDGRRLKNNEEESQLFIDNNLATKLDRDIEQLQKDRDSVYHLDDDFYQKLMTRYLKQEEEDDEPVQTSVLGVNHETIDDYRREESKRSDESSSHYTSRVEGSVVSGESEENDYSSYSHYPSSDIVSSQMSPIGIGVDNNLSNVLGRTPALSKKSIPMS